MISCTLMLHSKQEKKMFLIFPQTSVKYLKKNFKRWKKTKIVIL